MIMFCLLACVLICGDSFCVANRKTTNTVVINAHKYDCHYNFRISTAPLHRDQRYIALAAFTNRTNETGWSSLYVDTSSGYPDWLQAYWAGYAETFITYAYTMAHWNNTIGDMCSFPLSEDCRRLKRYLSENMVYMIKKSTQEGIYDAFWHQVHLSLWQLKGISDAFSQKTIRDSRILTEHYLMKLTDDVLGVYLLQLSGDLWDLVNALSLNSLKFGLNKLGHPYLARPSCSALVKLLPNDVYFSHTTWSPYSLMLRVIKYYSFPWRKFANSELDVPSVKITFSSYPSVISSIDDFYITSSQLAIMETTNAVYNKELWPIVRNGSKNGIFTFMRAMVANRLSLNGKEWIKFFSQMNSGTYNNQWIVFDAKLWSRKSSALGRKALFILEQLPGLIKYQDVTTILRTQTYWASYNLPYIQSIYNMSGTGDQAAKYGNWFVYNKTARAEMFRRGHHKIANLADMYRLMRYNDFKHDPYSKCECVPPYTAENAIAARSDLNDPNGKYPIPAFGFRLHGATDVKIVNISMIEHMQMLATSGPTHEQVPVFDWSRVKVNITKPILHPVLWNFPPVITNFSTVFLTSHNFIQPLF